MILLSHSFWRRSSPSYSSVPEYMEISPETARMVSAAAIQDEPIRYAPIAVDYEELGSGSIRTRLRPDSDWQLATFRIVGESIYWTHAEKEWPWQQIPQDELPAWFAGFASKAWNRMDERAAKAKQKEAESGPRE